MIELDAEDMTRIFYGFIKVNVVVFLSWCRDLSPLAESPVQPGSGRQLNQHEPAASDSSASEYPGRVRGSAHAACCYLDAAEI